MILRKPYAFLIKKFKLIHLFLALIVGYFLYSTIDMLKVYNTYIQANEVNDLINVIRNLFNPILYIVLFFFLLFNLAIVIILKIKNKSIKMYVISMTVSIITIIMYIYSYSILKTIAISSVDIRIVRATRDGLLILTLFQGIQLILMVVRATGFDIKKFDFEKDLIGLGIEESDSEEVELNFEFDSQESRRNIKKKLRSVKYVYLENKFVINILFVILIFSFVSFTLASFFFKPKNYKENEFFLTDYLSLKINKSYLTDLDSQGKKISDKYNFLVLDSSIKSFYKNYGINYGQIYIETNGKKYYPTTEYNDYFYDLGTPYIKQTISNKNYDDYLIIFALPKQYSDFNFVYENVSNSPSNENNKNIVNLNPKKINESIQKDITFGAGELFELHDSFLGIGVISIDSYELSKKFEVKYDFCTNNQCYDSVYYLLANSLKNYETVLLKITGSYMYDGHDGNLKEFLSNYGEIEFSINDKIYKQNLDFLNPKHVDENEYYVEINSDALKSEHLYINFNIRSYRLKCKLY